MKNKITILSNPRVFDKPSKDNKIYRAFYLSCSICNKNQPHLVSMIGGYTICKSCCYDFIDAINSKAMKEIINANQQ
jgi:hypothetical protein